MDISAQPDLGNSVPTCFSVELKEIDTVVMNVLTKFVQRSKFGKQKYGTDLDRTDLSVLDWIQHAQEEHMDAILYLEKLKQTVSTQIK